MAGGLALLLAKGKPSKDEMPMDDEEKTEGDEEKTKESDVADEFLGDAFDALKSGNKEAFVEALKSALESC